MGFCPSHDWDRHVAELDEAAEAEVRFYQTNADRIVLVASAILSNPNASPFEQDEAAG